MRAWLEPMLLSVVMLRDKASLLWHAAGQYGIKSMTVANRAMPRISCEMRLTLPSTHASFSALQAEQSRLWRVRFSMGDAFDLAAPPAPYLLRIAGGAEPVCGAALLNGRCCGGGAGDASHGRAGGAHAAGCQPVSVQVCCCCWAGWDCIE